MPIANLRYKLPEEEDAFKLAQRGSRYYGLLRDIDNVLRDVRKYNKKRTVALEEIEEILKDEPLYE